MYFLKSLQLYLPLASQCFTHCIWVFSESGEKRLVREKDWKDGFECPYIVETGNETLRLKLPCLPLENLRASNTKA